jgi:hypothetical protein
MMNDNQRDAQVNLFLVAVNHRFFSDRTHTKQNSSVVNLPEFFRPRPIASAKTNKWTMSNVPTRSMVSARVGRNYSIFSVFLLAAHLMLFAN